MPIQNITPATSDEILDDFLVRFEPTDNFKLDQEVMYQAVAQAMVSLLIRHKLTSKDFLQFFSGETDSEGNYIFSLKKIIEYKIPGELYLDNYNSYHKGNHIFEIKDICINSLNALTLETNKHNWHTSNPDSPPYPCSIYRIDPKVDWPNHTFRLNEEAQHCNNYFERTYENQVKEIRDRFLHEYTNLYALF